jgi:hypothetical protein
MMSDQYWINGAPAIVAQFPNLDHVIMTTGRSHLRLTRSHWRSLPIACYLVLRDPKGENAPPT